MARALAIVREELRTKQAEMSNILDQFPGDDFSNLDADQFKAAEGLNDLLASLESELAEASATEDRMKKMRDDLRKKQLPAAGRGGSGGSGSPIGDRGSIKTLGAMFVESAEYKAWIEQVAPGGLLPESFKGFRSPPVHFKSLITGVADASGGALIENQRIPGFLDLPTRPLVIRDIITTGTTTSDTIEYVQMQTMTNNAAAVPEAQSTLPIAGAAVVDVSTTAVLGGVKPESGFTFAKLLTAVKTLAHWIPATKRALADAGQLRTIIDNFLRDGLGQELEDQITSGDGIGENFLGIANVSGVQAQAWDTDLLVTLRKARTKVRLIGRATPSAYLLNPLDWETIQLIRENGANGPFMFGGPANVGAPRVWSLPVVESEAVPVGTGYCADFRQAVLWDREQANIVASDSHADFFIRNLVAVLGEMRAAFGILRPPAFVEMDLTA